jgi:acyl-CoA thioesterase FadM
MNLVFRMLYVLVMSPFRERLAPGCAESRLALRTMPNDLDINLHMNNGRYLTICDLTRVDLFIRSGLAKIMFRRGWMPLIVEQTMNYKKPLKLFERFEVSTAVTHWDERYFYMTHTFSSGDRVAAHGTSKAVLRSREGVLKPEAVITAMEESRGLSVPRH